MLNQLAITLSSIGLLLLLLGCNPAAATSSTPPPLADELILYNWVDYMPQPVLDAFAAEYGIKVKVITYESMEEAVAEIRAGQDFDVAVLEYSELPALVAGGFLAQIGYLNVPNFKNISANFRDLAFDPGNKHSVPFNWGTTGLIVRSDLVQQPITRWADLWDERLAGKIAMRPHAVEITSVALKSLGYPLNSEEPAQLAAAQAQLQALKPKVLWVEVESPPAVERLLTGEAAVLVGWSGDALYGREKNAAITYVLPEEGVFLWGDSLVISAKSQHKKSAELFLNFLLRPEISAQIVNTYRYPTANEAALPFVQPEIRTNPVVFPPKEVIEKAEWYSSLSPAGSQLYDEVWANFMAESQHSPSEKSSPEVR